MKIVIAVVVALLAADAVVYYITKETTEATIAGVEYVCEINRKPWRHPGAPPVMCTKTEH
jgi:hypothetical protein